MSLPGKVPSLRISLRTWTRSTHVKGGGTVNFDVFAEFHSGLQGRSKGRGGYRIRSKEMSVFDGMLVSRSSCSRMVLTIQLSWLTAPL
jgi:hypothetical protein